MNISRSKVAGDTHLVNLRGPLNMGLAEEVTRIFREIAEQGIERVIVDLAHVPFIDSRGLAALMAGYSLFGNDARNFRLAGLRSQPKLLFELTGFDQIFQTSHDVAQAMAAGSG